MKAKNADKINNVMEIESLNAALPELLAKLARGEEVVFAQHGTPVARLVPVEQSVDRPRVANDNGAAQEGLRQPQKRSPKKGTAGSIESKRRVWSPRDFDAPLPKNLAAALERCSCLPLARAECEGKKQ